MEIRCAPIAAPRGASASRLPDRGGAIKRLRPTILGKAPTPRPLRRRCSHIATTHTPGRRVAVAIDLSEDQSRSSFDPWNLLMRDYFKPIAAWFRSSGTSDMNLHFKSAAEIARLIRERKVSAVDALEHFLARIEKYNPRLNAVIWLDPAGARAQRQARWELSGQGCPSATRPSRRAAAIRPRSHSAAPSKRRSAASSCRRGSIEERRERGRRNTPPENRDRGRPRGLPLPHHRAYGSVHGGSMD
jgi:hypothetical protein